MGQGMGLGSRGWARTKLLGNPLCGYGPGYAGYSYGYWPARTQHSRCVSTGSQATAQQQRAPRHRINVEPWYGSCGYWYGKPPDGNEEG